VAGRVAGPVRWRRWAAAAVAAGLLAGGAGVATYLLQEQRVQEERDRVAQAQAQAAEIEAVLTAPDASVSQQPAAESGTVTVIGSRQRDGAVVVLAALPEPDADQAYQLWRRTGGELVSAGVLAAGVGSTTALVTGLGTADLIGVSLEPAAGSPTGQPTEGQIVATVPVT
jgi:anti-sigma-K factor RskA